MNILVYRWKAYNYTDVIASFQMLGHTVEELDYHLDNYDSDEQFAGLLTRKLQGQPYDFVFSMNYFGVISDVCEFCKVRYVSWSCDSPLLSMYHRSVYNSCNYIFLFDKSNFYEFLGMGLAHVYYLPLAVDCERIEHVLEQTEERKLYYQNEIAFVGSLYERNSYDRIKGQLPEFLQGYFEAVIRAQMDVCGGNIIEDLLTSDILMQLEEVYHLEKTEESFSNLGLVFSTTVLGFQVAKRQRRQALLSLAKKHDVTIYTNSDTSDLLGVTYRGGVDYWNEMPRVFHDSKINLNFTIPNIVTGIPLRVWDVLGAGGFLLTNYQAELPDYLKNKEDLVYFEDLRQLTELTDYYLAHEEERCAIAKHGQETVKKKHTYLQRIQKMLDNVNT